MATFGKTNKGATEGAKAGNYLRAMRHQVPSDCDHLDSLVGYCKYFSTTPKLKFGVYGDKAGPDPDAYYGESAEWTITVGFDDWKELVCSINVTPNEYVWLVDWHEDAGKSYYMYSDIEGTNRYRALTYNSFPNPFGATTSMTTCYSLYATYTPTGGGGLSIPVAMRNYRNFRTAITNLNSIKLKPRIIGAV